MTGRTPDLIRAWEKCYAVVAPGRAIGDVAASSFAALGKLVGQPAPIGHGAVSQRALAPREELGTRVLERLERFDHAAITRLLGDAVIALRVRRFVYEVVPRVVHHVGARWADGELSIAEEHLLTGMLRGIAGRAVQLRDMPQLTEVGSNGEALGAG